MNTVKLDLERKKKSAERSFLHGSYASPSLSSSSSDEEPTNDEENERARQKGGEESDERRPMAEEERKVTDRNNGELLLPWKVEIRKETQPRRLIEEISGSEQYVIGDAKEKLLEISISDNRRGVRDSIDDRVVDEEVVTYKKEISETEMEREKMRNLSESNDDDDETDDRKNEKTSTCSVSCDTSDLKRMLEEKQKLTGTAVGVRDDASSKNIKSYQRKSKEFGSKLSSIREEMREFCDTMDRFVDENKIVFKNGEVEGFWGERKMVDENLQTDSVDDNEIEETGIKVSASEEDKLRWWSAKERKLKVKEIIKKREDEAGRNKVEIQDTETSENSDRRSSGDKKQTSGDTNNFQDVYDLMTLKTCPKIFPNSTETYTVENAKNYCREQSVKVEKSNGLYSSLFAELRNRNGVEKTRKSKDSDELMDLEDRLDFQESIDAGEKDFSIRMDMIDLVDIDEKSSRCNSIVKGDDSTKIEMLEDKFNDFLREYSQGKKNVDESDDDSFKTASSLPEDSQVSEGNQGLSGIMKLSNVENNCEKITNSIKIENIEDSVNISNEKMILNEEDDNAIGEAKIDDKIVTSSNKMEISNSKQELSSDREKSNPQMESLVRTIDRLSLDGTRQSSKLMGKRIREAEDVEVGGKKSFLIEKINSGRNSEERKVRSQISERCRQHLIEETKKFTKRVSPLIDKCITSLMKDAENIDGKSRYHKYNPTSLGEYLPLDFASRVNLNKSASGEGNNYRDGYVTSAHSERKESIAKHTINTEFANTNDSDIGSVANLLRQSVEKSQTINANMSFTEFYNHLHEIESKKKLLIKPDFMRDSQVHEKELSDNTSLQEIKCSTLESVKPLIEVISESPVISKNIEQTLEREAINEKSHDSENILDCQQKDAVFNRLSEETSEISNDPGKYIYQESTINLKRSSEAEMFSTSGTLERTECKEECVLSNEKRQIIATDMKKSIEMQIAQSSLE